MRLIACKFDAPQYGAFVVVLLFSTIVLFLLFSSVMGNLIVVWVLLGFEIGPVMLVLETTLVSNGDDVDVVTIEISTSLIGIILAVSSSGSF